jgi:hypothetical protein
MRAALLVVALAGCNQLLGDHSFEVAADGGVDSGPTGADVCVARGLPPTTLSGVVYAPNGTLPVYGAVVYVPTTELLPIADGVGGACVSGAPIAVAHTDAMGAFHLDNVPSGNVKLVVQIGKWRREHVVVSDVQPCADNVVDPKLTRLPQLSAEGSLPHIAISTGSSESLECIARDLGVDATEIGTGASFDGHVHLYVDNGTKMFGSNNQPVDPLAMLFPSLASYDIAMIGCHGGPVAPPAAGPPAMQDWTNRGGWLFLDHDENTWLGMGPTPWPTLATFATTSAQLATAKITIDTALPIGQSYQQWLESTGIADSAGQIAVQQAKRTCTAVDATQVTRRLELDGALNGGTSGVQSFTWDASNGGRVIFNDLHVSNTSSTTVSYPAECSPLIPQETAVMLEMFETPTPMCN